MPLHYVIILAQIHTRGFTKGDLNKVLVNLDTRKVIGSMKNSTMFDELVKELIARIEGAEGRTRSRNVLTQKHFNHAVRVLVTDLWNACKSYPVAKCRINKRSGYYSENPRYRDKNLTYKQTMAAYDGLTRLGMIEATARGHFDHSTLQGNLTRYVARDELLERLLELEGHPALLPPYDKDAEIIIFRDKIDGKKINKEYEDTPTTDSYRSNLQRINNCLLNHWADLELRDRELPILADRITKHETKEPIDFSQRTLVRIFSNGSFKEGRRFYRGGGRTSQVNIVSTLR